MTPDDVAGAISQALVQGGQQFLVATIAAFMPALWAMTLTFHLARPYVLRTLRKLSLRFGADVWWLSYILVRDAVMILTFGLSLVFLMPNLALTMELPITAPLASLFLFWALYVKLLRDSDDDFRAFRAVTLLLVAAATLYFVPQVLGIEAADQDYLAGLASTFNSVDNPATAGPILAISLIGFGVTAAAIFFRVVFLGSRRLTAAMPEAGAAEAPSH